MSGPPPFCSWIAPSRPAREEPRTSDPQLVESLWAVTSGPARRGFPGSRSVRSCALSARRVGSGLLQFVRLHVQELRFAVEADASLFEEWH